MGGCCSKWGPGQQQEKESSKVGNTPKLNRLQHKESFSQHKNGVSAKGESATEKGDCNGYSTCYSQDPVKSLSINGDCNRIVDSLEEKLGMQNENTSPDLSIKAGLGSNSPEDDLHLNSEVSSISESESKSPKLQSLNNSSNEVDNKSDSTLEMQTLIKCSPIKRDSQSQKDGISDKGTDSENEEIGNEFRCSSKASTLERTDGTEMPRITSSISEEIDGIMSPVKNSGVTDEEFVTDVAVIPEPTIVSVEDSNESKVESNIIVNPLQDNVDGASLASYVQTITIESTITGNNKIENRAIKVNGDDSSISEVEEVDGTDQNIDENMSTGRVNVDRSPQSEDESCASKSVTSKAEDAKQLDVLCDDISKVASEDIESNINVNLSDTQTEATHIPLTDGDIPKDSPQLSDEVCETAELKGEKTIDNGGANDSCVADEDEISESRPSSEASIMSQRSIFFLKEDASVDEGPNINSHEEEIQKVSSPASSNNVRIYENVEKLEDLPPPPLPEEIFPPSGDVSNIESYLVDEVPSFPPPPQDDIDKMGNPTPLNLDSVNENEKLMSEISEDFDKASHPDSLLAPPCSSYVALVSPTGFGSSGRY